MLDRNRRIKKCPERFQDCKEQFDVIVTVEERVYDQVLEYMESRDVMDNRPVHIFNVDIEDNHEEALMGAFLITDMINMVMINNSCKIYPLTMGFAVQACDVCHEDNDDDHGFGSVLRALYVVYINPNDGEENLWINIVNEKTITIILFVLCVLLPCCIYVASF